MDMKLVPSIMEHPCCAGYGALSGLWSSHSREQNGVHRMSYSQSPLCCSYEPEGREEVKARKPSLWDCTGSQSCSHKPKKNECRESHAT